METRQVITTCTRDCPNTCGLVATVQDGRLVKLAGNPDHPLTKGVCCTKTARRYIPRVYSPERVTVPLMKKDGHFVRAAWDEVLDRIARTMQACIDESGSESILYYQGYGERTALKLLNMRFFNLLGGVSTMTGSLCGGAGQQSQNLDFGTRISHDPLDHYNARSMILWGRNPASTNHSLLPVVRDIKKRGGSVLVIDPASTKTTRLATRHIRPRSGMDGYLAMAAAKLVLQAEREDREFIQHSSEGFEAFKAILDKYQIDELCELAGVERAEAELLATTLVEEFPTAILLGWGLHRYTDAHSSLRAIDALGAIAGIIGAPGGGVSQGFEEYGPYDQRCWGFGLNPPRRQLLISEVGREILDINADPSQTPIRMIVVTAANPVGMAPNTARVRQAFASAECVVYSGHFLDDTAREADIILPATTFLEEDDVMGTYGHNYVGPVNKAIEPVGECRSEFAMFQELATRMGVGNGYVRPVNEWLEELCAPLWQMGATPQALRQGPFRQNLPMAPYIDGTFPTESGRFRFLQQFDPPRQPDASNAQAYPYSLLTIAPHGYICSERSMGEHSPLPHVWLHPDEARSLGLAEGAWVTVESEIGTLAARLQTDENMRRDVAVMERGGWMRAGHGINLLTRDATSVVGKGTPYYDTRVRVWAGANERSAAPAGGGRILVVQHVDRAPGGVFCAELTRQGMECVVVHMQGEEPLPASPDGYVGLVVLGGPQHAWDDETSPYFPPLMALMRAFDEANKPVAGICLGGQLLARAHGANTWNMGTLEYGFVQHRYTSEAASDPVFGSIDDLPSLMEFHEDSFELPPGGTLLVQGDPFVQQAFAVGNCSYGFQFHLEADALIVDDWIRLYAEREVESYAKYSEVYDEAFLAEMRSMIPARTLCSGEFCRRVAANWLSLASR